MSIWRLAPQFFLLGLMEGLAKDGLEGLANDDDHLSRSMKKFLLAIDYFIVDGIGYALNILSIFSNTKLFLDTLNENESRLNLDLYYKHLKTPLSFASCLTLCTDSSTHQECEEQVRKLRILLQQQSTATAENLIKTLILSKTSPFSSPNDLFTLFSVSLPSLKPLFTNMLLSVLSSSKMPVEALQLYSSLRKDGGFPSLASLNLLLDCLVTCHRFEDIVDSGFQPDKFTYEKAVQAAVKIGDLKRAREVVDLMKKRGVRPNVFIYNVLIGVLCKEKKMRDAGKLFDEMCKRNLVPTRLTYNTLIDGYCKAAELGKAFGLRERMKIENVEANLVTFNSLLSGLCKAKRMEEAKKVCQEMEANGFVPDWFTYSILFDGFSRTGDGEGVIALYKEAIGKGARINSYTCSILSEEIFGKEMENVLVPNDVMFNTIVNGYCRRGDINRAIFTIEQMENCGVRSNCITFNSLINFVK
ncbi:hypothetical protein Q3G72_009948 [Acer saccharum]|nr:hypothetical protein Q3G72_009948 [Acer saccharum]